MIYITFERGGPKFSNTIARAHACRTAVQQRQLTAKWLLCSTRFSVRRKSRVVGPSQFAAIFCFDNVRLMSNITNIQKNFYLKPAPERNVLF